MHIVHQCRDVAAALAGRADTRSADIFDAEFCLDFIAHDCLCLIVILTPYMRGIADLTFVVCDEQIGRFLRLAFDKESVKPGFL